MTDFQRVTQRCPNGHVEIDWEGPAGDGLKKVALGRPCPKCGKDREVEYEDIQDPRDT